MPRLNVITGIVGLLAVAAVVVGVLLLIVGGTAGWSFAGIVCGLARLLIR